MMSEGGEKMSVCWFFKCEKCGSPVDVGFDGMRSVLVTPCATCLDHQRTEAMECAYAKVAERDRRAQWRLTSVAVEPSPNACSEHIVPQGGFDDD